MATPALPEAPVWIRPMMQESEKGTPPPLHVDSLLKTDLPKLLLDLEGREKIGFIHLFPFLFQDF